MAGIKARHGGRVAILLGAALAVGSIGVFAASAGELQPICHRTGASGNPYVVNTPNNSGQVEGHLDHTGPVWSPGATDWGDIIPPQPGAPNGLNWDAAGMAIHANNCVPPDLPPPDTTPPPGGGGPGDPGTTATPTQPGTPGRPAPAVVGQPRTTG